jgi:hypothetical protein
LIWLKPRATICEVVANDPRSSVIPLAAVGGIANALLNRLGGSDAGDQNDRVAIVIGTVGGGAISGIIGLYVVAYLLRWTGRWLGGIGTLETIRAAWVWPNVIYIWMLGLWMPALVLFGSDLFTETTSRLDANPMLGFLLLAFFLAIMVLWTSAMVATVKCLVEVQGFLAWRGLANLALLGFVFFGAVLAIGLIVMSLSPDL